MDHAYVTIRVSTVCPDISVQISKVIIDITEPVVTAIGPERHERGTKLILHALQQPKLNKQVMS